MINGNLFSTQSLSFLYINIIRHTPFSGLIHYLKHCTFNNNSAKYTWVYTTEYKSQPLYVIFYYAYYYKGSNRRKYKCTLKASLLAIPRTTFPRRIQMSRYAWYTANPPHPQVLHTQIQLCIQPVLYRKHSGMKKRSHLYWLHIAFVLCKYCPTM